MHGKNVEIMVSQNAIPSKLELLFSYLDELNEKKDNLPPRKRIGFKLSEDN